MNIRLFSVVLTIAFSAVLNSAAALSNDLWLPIQIDGKVYGDMSRLGLRLSQEDIYDINNACITNAILSVSAEDGTFSPSATASFVSPDGLVLTNFHCVINPLRLISGADRDYVKHGCWSTARSEEMYLPNFQLNQLLEVKDVTGEILADTDSLTGQDLTNKINENSKKLTKAYGKGAGISAQVYSLGGGRQYVAMRYRSFKDVRIVAAPPVSVGKFGGDTDNWQWPRYSADFAFLRVYVNDRNLPAKYSKENVPYKTESYLPISVKGVKEGDFLFAGGYPSKTMKYVPSFALERIIFNDTKANADIAKIKFDYYTRCKESAPDSLFTDYNVKAGNAANIYLRSLGRINGVRESGLIERKRIQEDSLARWISADEDRKARYGSSLLSDMRENYSNLTIFNYAELMFNEAALYGANIIPFAGKFEKLIQISYRKGSAGAMKSECSKLKKLAGQFYDEFNIDDDRHIMKAVLGYYIEHVDTFFHFESLRIAAEHYPDDFSSYIDSLYAVSPLKDLSSAVAFLDGVPVDGIERLEKDPLYRLSLGFYKTYVDKINMPKQRYQNINKDLYSKYIRALNEKNGDADMSYDANRTLRFSAGYVAGAEPNEGIVYEPFTTLDGMVKRSRAFEGNNDFVLPSRFAGLISERPESRYFSWEEPVCCFLSSILTAAGSSGSPVLNADGELVGLNFDRIWQGISSEYEMESDSRSRNIVVDIRYILWVIDCYSFSRYVLDELTVR